MGDATSLCFPRRLETSRWAPSLDASGIPVAAFVQYTCHFKVDR